jgi:hypothetical protein
MALTRMIPIGLLAALVFGQSPSGLFDQAPPQLDQALRARVAKFYQAHVDGKFRVADQVVAEESKDAFFEADKTRYRGFEIAKITYSDQFTRALVLTTCDSEFITPVARFPVKMPITTFWKLENGEWFWYVDPRPQRVQTPFGKRDAPPVEPAPGPGGAPPSGGASGAATIPPRMLDASDVLNQVRVSSTQVKLSSFEPAAAEVTVSNRMPGVIRLSLSYAGFPGFTASLERASLGAGESAKILLDCKPADKRAKPTLRVELRIEPTGQTIPIQVVFAVPPDVEKLLPK